MTRIFITFWFSKLTSKLVARVHRRSSRLFTWFEQNGPTIQSPKNLPQKEDNLAFHIPNASNTNFTQKVCQRGTFFKAKLPQRKLAKNTQPCFCYGRIGSCVAREKETRDRLASQEKGGGVGRGDTILHDMRFRKQKSRRFSSTLEKKTFFKLEKFNAELKA